MVVCMEFRHTTPTVSLKWAFEGQRPPLFATIISRLQFHAKSTIMRIFWVNFNSKCPDTFYIANLRNGI